MKMYHRKKYHLKKSAKNIIFLIICIIIVFSIKKTNILKPVFKLCRDKYLIKEYLSENNSLKSKVAKSIFKSIEEEKKYDELFAYKEEKINEPIVYLYNTHQSEKYLSDNNMSYTPTVMTATSYLNEKLNSKNISTIMEYRSVSKVLDENNWKYGYSYKVSRNFINDTTISNPSIKYLFDIHRDSGSHENTTLCVEKKCYAKLLFLVGLENNNYYENQKYAEDLSKMVNERLNGLSKGILQKQGKNVNGIYNQDFSNRTMLIEIGGENNTINEVYNTIDILSDIIEEYIKKEIKQ